MTQDRRLGRFKVASEFLQLDNAIARRVMAKIIVMEVKRDWYRDTVEYIAYGDDFDEIDLGEIVPEYEVICSGDPIVVTFIRLGSAPAPAAKCAQQMREPR